MTPVTLHDEFEKLLWMGVYNTTLSKYTPDPQVGDICAQRADDAVRQFRDRNYKRYNDAP